MQNINDTKKMELELLNLRLAEIDAERDRIQQQQHALKSSLTKAGSAGPWSRATVAAVSVLAVASLLFIGDFHDAQSNVKKYDQPEAYAFSTQEPAQIVRAERHSASGNKLRSRSGKAKTFVARSASQRQWGPSLVMPEPVLKGDATLLFIKREQIIDHGRQQSAAFLLTGKRWIRPTHL